MRATSASYALVGNGSEWFWTAVSGLVLAATFIAIYRQLRLQASAMIHDQLDGILGEWRGEWMTRLKLKALLRIQDGRPLEYDAPLVWETCDFWEKVGGLARSGNVDLSVIEITIGPDILSWWSLMGPHVVAVREEISGPELYEHFEWLVQRILQREGGNYGHEIVSWSPEMLLRSIEGWQERIALYDEMRGLGQQDPPGERQQALGRPLRAR